MTRLLCALCGGPLMVKDVAGRGDGRIGGIEEGA